MAEAMKPVETPAANPELFQRASRDAFELHNSGRHAEAEAACRALLEQDSRDSQLLFLLGMILQKTGRNSEALKVLEKAAVLHPQSARIFNGLGFVHQSLKNPSRAVEFYGRAIELGLRAADTYYSMGNACHQMGLVEQAAGLFEKAVALAPRDKASWNNLGRCLNDMNRLEASIAAYDQSLTIDPQYSLARYGRALSLLAAGRLPEGFREYNQWRSHGIKPREFPQPRWQGEPIPGKTLFLHAEQGFGDAILYARFLPRVRASAAKLILECRPELKTLFCHSGIADLVIAYGEEIPPFDFYNSQASLPGIFGVALDTIPNQVPYLTAASPATVPAAPADSLKIGLVWAGNPSHHNDAARSMQLEQLLPLRQIRGVTFYSLQKPLPPRDEECFRSWPELVDLSGDCPDFLATVAAVAQMDLVIAVDTAIAHLAGAMGKPVWTLLPLAPDWRWLLDRQDTPWYPTMRLFRQTQRNQWSSVISRVAEELVKTTDGHKFKQMRL
jgi:Tfp pilus assembly protein PilF